MHAGRNTNSETNKPQKKNQLITLTVINTAIDSVPQPCDWCTNWFHNVYFWTSFSAPLLGLRFCAYHLSSSFWFIGMAEWEVLPRTARWPHGPVGLHAGPAVCHGEQPASGQQRGPQDQPSSNGGTVESMCVTAAHLFRMTQWLTERGSGTWPTNDSHISHPICPEPTVSKKHRTVTVLLLTVNVNT